jgi:hypothetical protein
MTRSRNFDRSCKTVRTGPDDYRFEFHRFIVYADLGVTTLDGLSCGSQASGIGSVFCRRGL